MRKFNQYIKITFRMLPLLLIMLSGCITEFIPVTDEKSQLMVVEGLVTDQLESYTVKISKSMALGKKSEVVPLPGCIVTISDDLGHIYNLNEQSSGIYTTDSLVFKGEIGRSYTLHISATSGSRTLHYESTPAKLRPVPAIDSVYYVKTIIAEATRDFPVVNGCQIYLDTHDPTDSCNFYRWDFTETWELNLYWPVENHKCWISEHPGTINIKNTTGLAETVISHNLIKYISNETDRLRSKYSIIVSQFSLNEDEFLYWEKLQNITQQVGGLYDIVPSSVPGNLQCIELPDEPVLGYFSVSAKSAQRIYIEDTFSGMVDPYSNCIYDTIPTDYPYGLQGYGTWIWALLIHEATWTSAPYTILTKDKGCADCTVRGSIYKPDFWPDEK